MFIYRYIDRYLNLNRKLCGDSFLETGLGRCIPVAEAISRAQKVFMTVELDHGKRFSYNTL